MGLGTGIFKRSLVILMSLAEKHLPKVTRVPSDQLHGMGVNLNDVHQLPRKRDKVTGISSTQGCPRSPKEGTQAAKMKPQAISHWLLPKFSFPGCKLTYFMIDQACKTPAQVSAHVVVFPPLSVSASAEAGVLTFAFRGGCKAHVRQNVPG